MSTSYSRILRNILFLTCFSMLFNCTVQLPEEVAIAYDDLPDQIDYNFHVKPILSDRCYQCHGPDEKSRKAGLRLDVEEEAFSKLNSGNYAFVKGNLRKSEAFHRLISSDEALKMPPVDAELTISPREIAIIAKWLEQGAELKQHWSLVAVESPKVPEAVSGWNSTNEIDRFVQAKLKEKGFEPSPEADKERLLRRVTMDLTGLPPTIEEITAFLNDSSPEAYERVVDRLLASDAHAERMAMEWMDIARYADSQGVSFDGARTSWPYKDWLIEAFRKNIPYDEFIKMQLAGDLIEEPTQESRIATAFVRMNPLEVSQGSIDEEFRMEYISERTGMVGTSFLGLTVECARCHDHKFDPISQKEFYQISAFFNTTEERGLSPTDADRGPTLLLWDDEQKKKFDSLEFVINARENELVAENDIQLLRNYMERWEEKPEARHALATYSFDTIEPYKKLKKNRNKKAKKEYEEIQITDGNKDAQATLNITLDEGKFGKALLLNEEYDYVNLEKVGEFDHYDPFTVSTWFNTTRKDKGPTQTIIGNSSVYIGDYRGWELALDSNMYLTVRMIHRLPDDLIMIRSTEKVEPEKWNHVAFSYDGSRKAAGIRILLNGEELTCDIVEDRLKRSMRPVVPYTMKTDTIPVRVGRSKRIWTFDVGLFEGRIDEVKIYNEQLSRLEMSALAENRPDQVPEDWKKEYARLNDPEFIQRQTDLLTLRKARSAIIDSVSQIMVMEEMAVPRKTYILNKGLYNQHLEAVSPGGIERVLPYTDEYPKNRLGLALWLSDRRNPLTSRVAVNRYWQMIFGKGLVRTPEDFGSQGERPTHPELLDWLAADFMESGWDLRRTLKLMVMSSTYRQSSFTSDEMLLKDPGNVYLARSHSYRLPAEMVRDNILAASGLLVNKVGGPPVKPYQPEGVWDDLDGTSYQLTKYKQDTADNLYRRSMYTIVRRFAPHPFMTNFDASSREICLIKRDVTNSPMQALTLLNDPQILEASRILSERVQQETDSSLRDELVLAYRLSTGTTPSEEKIRLLTAHFKASLGRFENDPAIADSILQIGEKPWNKDLDKNRTAALALVANSIFNYDESYMKR